MKKCSACKQTQPLDAFAVHRGAKDGLQHRCRACSSEYNKSPKARERAAKYRARPERRAHRADYMLKRRYGISLEAWGEILVRQGGRCPGCGSPLESGFKTHVDHCHVTGRVRGLLCKECNLALGNVNDSIDVLRNLIQYLTGA